MRCAPPTLGPTHDSACPTVKIPAIIYQNEEDEIETREQCCGEIDVFSWGLFHIVSSEEWICRAKKRDTRIQRRLNSCFAQRDSLLLHHLSVVGSQEFYLVN